MPRKTNRCHYDNNERFRICVALDSECAKLLEKMTDRSQQSGKPVGLSDIVRAAILHFHDTDAWIYQTYETPATRRQRQKLRKITQPDQSKS